MTSLSWLVSKQLYLGHMSLLWKICYLLGFTGAKGQAPTFMRTCLNMVLVNDAMFSHWYGISYPLRNPKHECAHFVNK